MSTRASDLLRLTDAERIQLAQELWDSIAADSPALSVSDEQREEFARRWAEHRRDPTSAIAWTEARRGLQDRFGT